MVYEVVTVLTPKIYLKSTRVVQFNETDQDKARELDTNLLEEKRNKTIANVKKYQECLKCHYNKMLSCDT
jgi:hypothetical protein